MLMKKYSLELAVFICGAALMILELAGSRVLAPYVGTSLVVWTSLIGIIMGFLSLGYYVGGKIADREAKPEKLAVVILASAFFVLLIVFINAPILKFVRLIGLNLYSGAIISTLALFAMPSFILGIVSPYAVKLKMSSLDYTGRVVGDLYAISTVGSIVGTFAAGFLLIPFLGTVKILYFITVTLALASLLVWSQKFIKARIFTIFILVILIIISLSRSASASPSNLIDIDSQYSRLWIYKTQMPENKRPILVLSNDPQGIQSGMFLDRDDDLVFKYLKYYRLADLINPNIQNALVIGGAAYSYPKDFLKNHKNANLDVVEIDSKMTELAEKYFHLSKDNPHLHVFHQDARVFLNENKKKYDAIYVDAFNSSLSVPYQLTTREAVQNIYNSLDDGGAVIINLISAIDGDKGKFLRAEYATYQSVFPQLHLFQVYNTDPDKPQNLILIGVKSTEPANLKSDDAVVHGLLDTRYMRNINLDMPILTDDYAPVDYYTMSLIR
jgi:spermidine synthase